MKLGRFILALACTAATAAVLGSAWWVVALGPVPKAEDFELSTQVVDREGRLLRAYATTDGRWRLPAALDGVDNRYVEMLLTCEDKRFPRSIAASIYGPSAARRSNGSRASASFPAAR